MPASPDGPWPRRDDELRLRWHAGETTAQIGVAMGLSKNSVVGRAHRIGLERGSPIKRLQGPKPPAVSKAQARQRAAAQIMQDLAPAAPEGAPAPPLRPFSPRLCAFPMWPHGERPGLSPRFCEAPVQYDPATERRSPYCPTHHRKCYSGVRYISAEEKAAARYLPGGQRAQPSFP